MDFNLSSEQDMLIDGARRFVRENCGLERKRAVAAADGVDRENWAAFAEMGWLMLPVAEEAGGLGGSAEDVALLMTVFGAGLVADPYVTSVVLCGTILAGGEAEAGRGLVEAISSGEAMVALAHDEVASAQSTVAIPTTVARADGGVFRISGSKRTVLDGPSAGHLIVSAALDGDIALFLASADAPGLAIVGHALIDGTRSADVVLSEVESGVLLARGDVARALLAGALDAARLANLAQAVGSIEAVLDLCSEYLKTRQQFGRPIGQFQALQHIMAEMFVQAQEARSILYFAIASADADPPSRARAVRQASIVIGEAGQLVSRQAVQLHGGYGITDEFAVGHHFKRLLTLEKRFGDMAGHLDQEADLIAEEARP